jgi:hypothetical protein
MGNSIRHTEATMGIPESSSLFLSFNHWAAVAAAAIFVAEAIMLGLAMAGGRGKRAPGAAAQP